MTRRLLVLLALVVGTLGILAAPLVQAQVVPPLPPPLAPPPPEEQPPPPPPPQEQHPALPADSGSGRRIVYAVSQQRVWIVEADERVSDSWLVSGREGTPRPGTYSIYSRSRWTTSGNGKVRMEFMLRFVRTSGLAIGFHAIPVDRRGRPIQSESELGQPRSKGCVRQARSDAEHLWHWAPDGTTVRVTS